MTSVKLLRQMLRPSWLALAPLTACAGEPPPPVAPSQPQSRPRASAPTRSLELEPKVILSALKGNEADLHACFDAAPSAEPGFVQLSWHVDAEGLASRARVERSAVADEAIGQCLRERVEALRFGTQERPAIARWTFVSELYKPDPEAALAKQKREQRKKKKRRDQPRRERTESGVAIERGSPGFIEPSLIDEAVQAGFGLFAHCYRSALERHPKLEGVVRLRFVIDEDGAVSSVRDGGSAIDDPALVDCVAEGFFALAFPRPRRGDVRVLYRVVFDAGYGG
jgi:hypothetical protein